MLVEDLLDIIDGLAPGYLAQQWDNSGLQVGDASAPVKRVLASLEVTEDVLTEATTGGCDLIFTHHPLLFSPVQSLLESRPKERLLRRTVADHLNVISCHTNLDAARGGLADIVAEQIGIVDSRPLQPASADWVKLIGFIPEDAVDHVADAVFSAGGGGVGDYAECAFASTGLGWFTPRERATPAVGRVGEAERVKETRWETVVPRQRMASVVSAFVGSHPYEEPAFDLVPVEDILPTVGLGRVGILGEGVRLHTLVDRVRDVVGIDPVVGGCLENRVVRRVAVLPGSGRGMLDKAYGQCEVLITGESSYHDAEEAEGHGLTLIDVPHGEIEWWAFKKWVRGLSEVVGSEGVEVRISQRWSSPWSRGSDLESRLREED